jgi:hypothetical protein
MLACGHSSMTRAEFVQRLILNSICDDFENVDQVILRDVAEVGTKCGLTIQRREIVEGLRQLVSSGLAKAYALSPCRDPLELDGMPPLDVVEEDFRTYFYVTKKGIDFHEADGTWWPLNDDGALRSAWKPPEP